MLFVCRRQRESEEVRGKHTGPHHLLVGTIPRHRCERPARGGVEEGLGAFLLVLMRPSINNWFTQKYNGCTCISCFNTKALFKRSLTKYVYYFLLQSYGIKLMS